MRYPRITFLTAVLLTGCGSLNSSDHNGSADSRSSGEEVLLYTASDITFSSSQLFRMDLEKEDLKTTEVSSAMVSGSGDMVLMESGNRVFLFNRRAGDKNFRQITAKSDEDGTKWELGPQLATPAALAGDPHDILVLDGETMMLANYVRGVVAVVNYKTGDLVQEISVPRKELKDGPFRPESFWRISETSVAVLHQGYDENYMLNGTQAIYVLEKDKDWQVSDDKGPIAIPVSVPQGLFSVGDQTVDTVGLCYLGREGCDAGIVAVDFEDMSAETALEIDNEVLTYYGGPHALPERKYLMSAQISSQGESATHLTEVDTEAKSHRSVYEFPNRPTSGYWGLDVSLNADYIYLGDPTKNGEGMLSVIDRAEDEVVFETKTKLVPYSMLSLDPTRIED